MDATYLIQVRLSRRAGNGANEDVPRFDESHDLELSVDGARVALFTLAGDPALPGQQVDPNYGDAKRNDLDASWEVRLPLRAGPRDTSGHVPRQVRGGGRYAGAAAVRATHSLLG